MPSAWPLSIERRLQCAHCELFTRVPTSLARNCSTIEGDYKVLIEGGILGVDLEQENDGEAKEGEGGEGAGNGRVLGPPTPYSLYYDAEVR